MYPIRNATAYAATGLQAGMRESLQVPAPATTALVPAVSDRAHCVNMLRGEVPVDAGRVLSWMTAMREWPGVPVALHAGDGAMVQCHGPTPIDAEPVRVMRSPDGVYSALFHEPGGVRHRVGCGIGANGLCEAVLIGLQLGNGALHARLTETLRNGMSVAATDAQLLCEHLMQCVATGPADPTRARLISTGWPPTCGSPFDVEWLGRVSRMTADELLHAGGLAELVSEVALMRDVREYPSRAQSARTAKAAHSRRMQADPHFRFTRLTAPRLRQLLADRCNPDRKTFGELVDIHGFSANALLDFMYVDYLPKARGVDLLWREVRGHTIPLGPIQLKMFERMHLEGRLPTEYHLLVVAYLCGVAYDTTIRCITPLMGLTAAGRALLQTGKCPSRARAAPPPDRQGMAPDAEPLPSPELTNALLDVLGDEWFQPHLKHPRQD